MTDVRTMNLSDNSDGGMVSLNNNQSTNFVPNTSHEKNIENKQTMDSTPISDIMGQAEDPLEPPMMAQDPRMTQMQMQAPMMMAQQTVAPKQTKEKSSESKNPFNLTDDQFEAIIVAACAAVAISKPVQEKLASTIPSFLNDQGNRGPVGLATTGVVAAIVFYILKRYVK